MRRLLVVVLCVTAIASVAGQRARDEVLTQELVVGLATGQHARLHVLPVVTPDFEVRSTLINVFADDGQLLASSGRMVVPRGATTPAALTFAHTGSGRRLVRFQYQLGGVRHSGASRSASVTTRPGAPGTLAIQDAGADSPAMLLPVPAFTTTGAAASCALPPSGPTLPTADRATRGRLLTGEFPLVALARGQALQLTLADTLPQALRDRAALGLSMEVVGADGLELATAPDVALDRMAIRNMEWAFGTELPAPPGDAPARVLVRYAVTCDGACDDIARWLARAQPVGPPLTPGLHVFTADTGASTQALLVPAVQKVRDAGSGGGGGGGGGGGTPPPPPPNT